MSEEHVVIEPPGGSMFELMFPGAGERGFPLLAALGFKKLSEIGRYRTAWLEDHGDHIEVAVYTRNGGGNRDGYAAVIDALRARPDYVRDADDTFDSTYATFYFRVDGETEKIARTLWQLEHVGIDPPVDTTAMWKRAEQQLSTNPTEQQQEFGKQLMARLGFEPKDRQ